MAHHLLTDAQLRSFLVEGCITIQPALPPSFHRQIYDEFDRIVPSDHVEVPGRQKPNNPGNNILPLVPALGELFDDPVVKGALTSLAGPDHFLEPHRALHNNMPIDGEQQLHKDSYMGFKRHVRSHRPWTIIVFYYPQETPSQRGPTGVVPGSHYALRNPGFATSDATPLGGPAGSVCLVAFDLWHARMRNFTNQKRFMLKFLVSRMTPPTGPDWDCAVQDWQMPAARPRGYALEPLWRRNWDWLAGNKPTNGADLSSTELADLDRALDCEDENAALSASYALARAGSNGVAVLARKFLTAGVENIEDDPSINADLGRQYAEGPVARAAAYGLAASGAAAIAPLVEAIRSPASQTRKLASFALGELAGSDPAIDDALARATGDADPRVRLNAQFAIGRRRAGADPMAALEHGLADADDETRIHAALALARRAPASDRAIAAAARALGDGNRYVSGYAVEALERIGTPEATRILVPFLKRARWCPFTRSGESIY